MSKTLYIDLGGVLPRTCSPEERARAIARAFEGPRLRPIKDPPTFKKTRPGKTQIVGQVYVVGFAGYIKIGWTGDLGRRLRELEQGVPEPLVVHHTMPGTRRIERSLHHKFKAHRLRGEWFRNEGLLAAWIALGCAPNAFSILKRQQRQAAIRATASSTETQGD